MTTPDYRALCAELLLMWDGDERYADNRHARAELLEDARAALAEPQQGAPSGRELQWPPSVAEGCHQAAVEAEPGSPMQQLLVAAGDLLESYGAHPAPVPVSEGLPDRSHCDGEGRVWWLIQNVNKPIPTWALGAYRINKSEWAQTHWLPHWVLPLPLPTP